MVKNEFIKKSLNIGFYLFTASKSSIKIDGVRAFTYGEMSSATNNFSNSAQVGQGGYGKVYKGILSDGTVVAIKRAQEGSLQGEKEFLTEIQLLSRLHHRNLVSLVGYCDEEGEQVLFVLKFRKLTLAIFYFSKFYDYLGFLMSFLEVLMSTTPIGLLSHFNSRRI